MSAFLFSDVPEYFMSRFVAVRNSLDNVHNLLNIADIVNSHPYAVCVEEYAGEAFDFAVFSGDSCRVLIRKQDGYFSMSIPFQIIDEGDFITFNFDAIGEVVNGALISILRNAMSTAKEYPMAQDAIAMSLEDSFGLNSYDISMYCGAFFALLADDHGYFRVDDDPGNQNGDIHPRYHFDFFYKNTSTVKVGLDDMVDVECFYDLFSKSRPKRYLRV
jgi:hypothetical protein